MIDDTVVQIRTDEENGRFAKDDAPRNEKKVLISSNWDQFGEMASCALGI